MRSLPVNYILLFCTLWFSHSVFAAQTILVFGDSLSAGYGIAVEESWPHLLQQELVRRHPGYAVVNASISGETTYGGRQRIAKVLQQHGPVIVIVELGANDGLRGYRIADSQANLDEIIRQSKSSHARVLLAGMRLPPNYGAAYTKQFQNIFPALAAKHRVALLPFLLEGVAQEQFQPDNLHPTAAAQPRIMRSVLEKLKPWLR